jgi:hypothetical protein
MCALLSMALCSSVISFSTKQKKLTDIDHHDPRPMSIICHLPDPPSFSLFPTFKNVYWGFPEPPVILKSNTVTLFKNY